MKIKYLGLSKWIASIHTDKNLKFVGGNWTGQTKGAAGGLHWGHNCVQAACKVPTPKASNALCKQRGCKEDGPMVFVKKFIFGIAT